MTDHANVQKINGSASIYVDAEGQKAIRPDKGGTIATFVMSSLSTDRDGERIDPNGWKVPSGTVNVLVDHDYKVSNVVGKIVGTRAEGDQYLGDVQFADNVAENTLAKFVVGMLHADFLGPVSVGFMPLKWLDPDGKTYTKDNPGPYWGPLPGRMYVEQELLELSMVAVGSNRDAMLVGMRAFGLGTSVLTEQPVLPEPNRTDGASPDPLPVVIESPESWLQKYLPRAQDENAGAALSREQIDRLTEARHAAEQAMKACDAALQSAERADQSK